MRIKSYKEAVRLARAAGEDAANRRMRKAGRKAWSAADHDHAARVTGDILTQLGYDVIKWATLAGVPRNEPEPPPPQPRKRSRRRAEPTAEQLSFAFA